MTILIDPTSTTPLYEQIVQQIQRQILSGTLPQGELLPGVRTLAADLSVSIITTRRAYEELERDGYIKTLPGGLAGTGCFGSPGSRGIPAGAAGADRPAVRPGRRGGMRI